MIVTVRTPALPYKIAQRGALCLKLTIFSLGVCSTIHAQDQPRESPVASSTSTETSEVPQVPGLSGILRGVNAGVTLSGLHDAQTGWATLAQPAISLTLNDHLSFDITVPIYMFRLAESRAAKSRPNALLVPQRAEPGDITFGAHAEFTSHLFHSQVTVAATAPTGDVAFGLSSGRSTFDATGHFEHNFRHVTPNLESGVGDSSTLVNRLVTKSYTSLGPLAHFQIGAAFPLPLGISFDANAYEQLPIGDQKIYRNRTRRGKTTTFVAGRNVTEDNGFITSFDLPIDPHTTISTYYNRSLRQKDDVVSVGITYVLRGAKPPELNEASTPLNNAGKRGLDAINTAP